MDSLVLGHFEITEAKLSLSQSCQRLDEKTELLGTLKVKIVETKSGTTIWSNSIRAQQALARGSLSSGGTYSAGAQDRELAEARLIETLIYCARTTSDPSPSSNSPAHTAGGRAGMLSAMNYTAPTEMLAVQVDKAVLTIRLNRPEALNAFRPEMLLGLESLVQQADADPEISVIVLEGEGRAFSAGVDLKVLQGIDPQGGKIGDVFDEPARRAYLAIRRASCPVIAKVHGACFTGALEIALHCDFIFTTETTKFGDTHAKFGLRPTWGMTQTLAEAVGIRRAKELSFSARTFLGTEAVELGVANAAFADKASLDARVAELAQQIAANSAAAVSAIKDLYALSQDGHGVELALEKELGREYSNILDTKQRLAGF